MRQYIRTMKSFGLGLGFIGLFSGHSLATPFAYESHTSFKSSHLAVSENGDHTCAIVNKTLGEAPVVECWGDNTYGQLGNPYFEGLQSDQPQTVQLSGTPLSVTAGEYHTCAMVEPQEGNNQVFCWGRNNWGQLGNGNLESSATPQNVSMDLSGIQTVKNVSAGTNHTCATTAYNFGYLPNDFDSGLLGEAHCWGANNSNQLNNSDLGTGPVLHAHRSTPLIFNTLPSVVGHDKACVVNILGLVVCWGDNRYDQLGSQPFDWEFLSHFHWPWEPRDPPYEPIPGDPEPRKTSTYTGWPPGKAISIVFGQDHTCVLSQNEPHSPKVYCLGRNDSGQLGKGVLGVPFNSDTSVQLAGTPIAITAGNQHTCALVEPQDGENQVQCWGSNSDGQVGDGTFKDSADAQTVTLDGVPFSVSAGGNHTCALTQRTDGTSNVQCWGSNLDQQINPTHNSPQRYGTPVSIDLNGKHPILVEAHPKTTCLLLGSDDFFSSQQTLSCFGHHSSEVETFSSKVPASGLKVWLDASDSRNVLSSSCGTVAVPASIHDHTKNQVRCWRDKRWGSVSGLMRFRAEYNHASNPTYTNDVSGEPSMIGFDGVGDMFASESVFMNTTNHSIFVVMRSYDESSDIVGTNTIGQPGDLLMMMYQGEYRNHFWEYGEMQSIDSGRGYNSISKKLIYQEVNQGATPPYIDMYINGNYITGHNMLGNPTSLLKPITIGARNTHNGEFLNGRIGEILIFDRVVSSAERKSIEAYLMQKWNIR